MPTVVTMGDTVVEICMQVSDAWDISPDVVASGETTSAGGSAANFSAIAAALGLRSLLVTDLGDDLFTDFLTSDLTGHGVDLSLARSHAGGNSMCIIMIGADGDRRFVSFRAPAHREQTVDSQTSTDRLGVALASADWLHVSGFWLQSDETADIALYAASEARRLNIPVSLDPSPQIMVDQTPQLRRMLGLIDVIFPNAFEARSYTGLSAAAESAAALHTSGIPTVVVTDGAAGAVLVDASGEHAIEACAADCIDTTGAGDALAAGFVAASLAGLPARTALGEGIKAASLAISKVGGHAAAHDIGAALGRSHPTGSIRDHIAPTSSLRDEAPLT